MGTGMALADQIQALRDQVLADLNAAYDYHADTTRGTWLTSTSRRARPSP